MTENETGSFIVSLAYSNFTYKAHSAIAPSHSLGRFLDILRRLPPQVSELASIKGSQEMLENCYKILGP